MSQSESAYSAIADWHWTTSNTPEVAIRAPYGDMGTSQRRNGDVRTWWHVGKIGPWWHPTTPGNTLQHSGAASRSSHLQASSANGKCLNSMGGELSKRQGVLFDCWSFGWKCNGGLYLFFSLICSNSKLYLDVFAEYKYCYVFYDLFFNFEGVLSVMRGWACVLRGCSRTLKIPNSPPLLNSVVKFVRYISSVPTFGLAKTMFYSCESPAVSVDTTNVPIGLQDR